MRVNQCLNPLKRAPWLKPDGYGPGERCAGTPSLRGDRLPAALPSLGACGECPRDRHAMPAGEELGTDPAKRTAVNVGTRPVPPSLFREAGKAQRRLMAPGGGIALVVVAGVTTGRGGRESRLQGEGEQWACGPSGMRGGRR